MKEKPVFFLTAVNDEGKHNYTEVFFTVLFPGDQLHSCAPDTKTLGMNC